MKFGAGWNWPTGQPFLQPPHVASATNPRFCARSPRSPPLTPNGREKCYTRSIWRPAMTSSDDVIVKDPQIMGGAPVFRGRSEEHTSELQSRLHLVCRLLLDKKTKMRQPTCPTLN